ncbi:MAG: oxidoreductase [Firmicutes bacterium HGW-Firmicutes-10]|jgi:predicted dehydrogenase|nr:MAG: oxidoreductase [Firmicutes bacterium HGW-Firmicutes-10]
MNLVAVGTSWITDMFISAALDTRQIRFLGTCSRSTEKAEAMNLKYGGEKVYLTIEEVCQDTDVDIVYIASPNSLHYPQTKKVLLAGKHSITEKPIVSNIREMNDLIEMSKTSKGLLFEAITTLHMPGLEVIRQHLSMLGNISIISTEFNTYSGNYPEYLLGKDPNELSLQFSGSTLVDLGIYNVYFVMLLFGIPTNVRYFANKGFSGVDLSGALIMQYPDKIAVAVIAKDNPGDNRTLIQGENGYIKITGYVNSLPKIEISVKGEKFDFILPHYPNHMRHECEAMFSCIARNDRQSMSEWLDLSKSVTEILQTARKDAGIVFAADITND